MRKLALLLGLAALVLLSVGCTTLRPTGVASQSEPDEAQATTSLEEYLAQAVRAEGAGDKEKARTLYRTASKAYPVAEEPWRKLAESYFNAGDYGNAILASQEVTQRNPKDAVAASVLAISGLRLSTQALSVLREQADAMRARSGSTVKPQTKSAIIVAARLEAETLARHLREVLGEPVLVPSESAGTGVVPAAPRARAAAPARSAPPPSAAARPAQGSATSSTGGAPLGAGNSGRASQAASPFDRLR